MAVATLGGSIHSKMVIATPADDPDALVEKTRRIDGVNCRGKSQNDTPIRLGM